MLPSHHFRTFFTITVATFFLWGCAHLLSNHQTDTTNQEAYFYGMSHLITESADDMNQGTDEIDQLTSRFWGIHSNSF